MREGIYVVVRTYSAGVHCGELVRQDGKTVELAMSRRIWSWTNANTLNEIANNGVGKNSRVSEPCVNILLTEAIEIIQCTPQGSNALREAIWSK